MKKITHWNPRYIFNRLLVIFDEKFHPDNPWLTRSAILILSSYLKKTDVGLEWGSGRSTAWFAERIKQLISVEHNPEWYQKVKEKLISQQLNNVDYRLIENEQLYAEIIDSLPDDSLDFILVDGLSPSVRGNCAFKSVAKLKMGGVLVIDNVNWFLPSNSHSPNSRSYQDGLISSEWAHFLGLVKDWRIIWTTNGVTDTALFIRTV